MWAHRTYADPFGVCGWSHTRSAVWQPRVRNAQLQFSVPHMTRGFSRYLPPALQSPPRGGGRSLGPKSIENTRRLPKKIFTRRRRRRS